ncbi:aspartate aminotransferas-like protein [Periconia macrospinosa]|uniref:Aspartate aminotransferase n=1 Tax=Periconia macrospinosa TaxID=97972 RepID=A0A2V1DUV2_9PLEO|nr:aspartate aminotransferas-like protein [Periconia macrospinosa]
MGSIESQERLYGLATIPKAPADPLIGMKHGFLADKSPEKVGLVVGAYRDDKGRPWRLPAVIEAEKRCFEDSSYFKHEYAPILGIAEFTHAASQVLFGKDSPALKEKRVCSVQALSGTGAIHIGALLLSRFLPSPTPWAFVPAPTWHLHTQCFEHVGLTVKQYPYYDGVKKSITFTAMESVLRSAPPGSIVLLQVCAHNPTGMDLDEEQWRQIVRLVQEKRLVPFLDCAYQGFASGSLTKDNLAIRLFVEAGVEMVIAQSFSKTMGLYGQRVGCFHYVAAAQSDASGVVERVASQLAILIRSEMSSPPSYGARVASIVLNDLELYSEWERNLVTMSSRITEMRWELRQELERLETPGTWKHLTDQIGMFGFTGLTPAQCQRMKSNHHIHMPASGRISISDLNPGNVARVAVAIDEVVRWGLICK